MSINPHIPPLWLLEQEGLAAGEFNEDRTVIINGRFNAHNSAVHNIGHGPPTGTLAPIDLKKRQNWETLKKRLADEGF